MKRGLLAAVGLFALTMAAQTALAADIPTKAPAYKAPVAAPIFNWTGWYGGLNYGRGVSQTHGHTDFGGGSVEGSFDRAGSGFVAGVQGGYNWQLDPRWVVGIEGDIGWLGIDHRRTDWNNTHVFAVKTDWYATLRARLGHTDGPSLFYLTGGAAFVHVQNDYGTPATSIRSASEVATGWTAGWGIETMLGGNWTAKAEYLYIDAGSNGVFNPDLFIGSTTHFDNRFHVFRQGLNYRFGSGTMAAALPAFNWTGFYAGLNAGIGVSQVSASHNLGGNDVAEVADAGFTGGFQAGYNWQFARNWVAGVEADIGWLGIDRRRPNWGDADIVLGAKTGWYGTARGRVGYSTGPALLYVTGGGALVRVKNNYDHFFFPATAARSETATGWILGGGIEAALAGNWTAKSEYLYIDAGSQRVTNPGNNLTATFDNRFHVFRFGLNYRFATGKAPGTVMTRY